MAKGLRTVVGERFGDEAVKGGNFEKAPSFQKCTNKTKNLLFRQKARRVGCHTGGRGGLPGQFNFAWGKDGSDWGKSGHSHQVSPWIQPDWVCVQVQKSNQNLKSVIAIFFQGCGQVRQGPQCCWQFSRISTEDSWSRSSGHTWALPKVFHLLPEVFAKFIMHIANLIIIVNALAAIWLHTQVHGRLPRGSHRQLHPWEDEADEEVASRPVDDWPAAQSGVWQESRKEDCVGHWEKWERGRWEGRQRGRWDCFWPRHFCQKIAAGHLSVWETCHKACQARKWSARPCQGSSKGRFVKLGAWQSFLWWDCSKAKRGRGFDWKGTWGVRVESSLEWGGEGRGVRLYYEHLCNWSHSIV